jgi:hypothetical protein
VSRADLSLFKDAAEGLWTVPGFRTSGFSPVEMEFLGNGIEVTSLPASGVDRGNKSVIFQARSVGHDRCPEKQFDQEPNLINHVIAHGGGSGIAPSYPARDSAFHRGFTADVTF